MNIEEQFRRQAEWCRRLDSPFYAELMTHTVEEYARNGPVRDLLKSHERDAGWSLPLKLMGAVHRIVLEGRAPDLARFYASVGGTADAAGAWPAFHGVIAEHMEELRRLVGHPVQTNEVNRS